MIADDRIYKLYIKFDDDDVCDELTIHKIYNRLLDRYDEMHLHMQNARNAASSCTSINPPVIPIIVLQFTFK